MTERVSRTCDASKRRHGQHGRRTLHDAWRRQRCVPKTEPRLLAIAQCEDATAAIGLVLALGGRLPDHVTQLLGGVQNDLLDVAADLHTPVDGQDGGSQPRIDESYRERVRYPTEFYSQGLVELSSSVVPGGTAAAAFMYQARSNVRLAELYAWQVVSADEANTNPTAAGYLDDLGDLMFVLARSANAEHGDTNWRPGLSAIQAQEAEQEELVQAGRGPRFVRPGRPHESPGGLLSAPLETPSGSPSARPSCCLVAATAVQTEAYEPGLGA